VLSRYPDDPGALNGVGSVLFFLGDLKGAEFYIRRALTEAKKQGASYSAAEHDLALVSKLAR
jgi:Flp pilus assembly protein TadD